VPAGLPDGRCIVTVHAHPDDEASKGASTIARYHDEGVRTVLVCCTGGEEGDVHNPAMLAEGGPLHGLTPEEIKERMPALREAELAAATAAIGFDEVVMLGYRDSGMPDTEANKDPRAFANADFDECVGKLVAVLRKERPQVLLTYGDDQKGYPHPDHLRVHDISIAAYERASDPAWYPGTGEPWQVDKVYYNIWARARMVAVHEALLRLRGESPYDEKWFSRPGQDERITTRLDVRKYLWARTEALKAHATQVDPTAAFWFGLSDDEMGEAYPYEDWMLARSMVGMPPTGELEDDLFAGIPPERLGSGS
jgi:mycothiol S-conjugate amidase